MFETELKARLDAYTAVLGRIRRMRPHREERAVYADTYFDRPGQPLARSERELRLRSVRKENGECLHLLTYKEPPFDETSKSKPEYETSAGNPDAMREILERMGYRPGLSFVKECLNLSLRYRGYDLSVTLARLPELEADFIEAEIGTEREEEIPEALRTLHAFMAEAGIEASAITPVYYTDLIGRKREDKRRSEKAEVSGVRKP